MQKPIHYCGMIIWFLYHARNRENVKVFISRTYRAVSTGEMRRAPQKQIFVLPNSILFAHLTLPSLCESTKTTSTWKHRRKNQLKPQALENTYKRTLKLQWLFTITHRNTHELNRTLNLYKLTAFHRSYKLMTLTKSSWFRPPYYHRCWRTCSWLVASCVSNGYCHSSAIC